MHASPLYSPYLVPPSSTYVITYAACQAYLSGLLEFAPATVLAFLQPALHFSAQQPRGLASSSHTSSHALAADLSATSSGRLSGQSHGNWRQLTSQLGGGGDDGLASPLPPASLFKMPSVDAKITLPCAPEWRAAQRLQVPALPVPDVSSWTCPEQLTVPHASHVLHTPHTCYTHTHTHAKRTRTHTHTHTHAHTHTQSQSQSQSHTQSLHIHDLRCRLRGSFVSTPPPPSAHDATRRRALHPPPRRALQQRRACSASRAGGWRAPCLHAVGWRWRRRATDGGRRRRAAFRLSSGGGGDTAAPPLLRCSRVDVCGSPFALWRGCDGSADCSRFVRLLARGVFRRGCAPGTWSA